MSHKDNYWGKTVTSNGSRTLNDVKKCICGNVLPNSSPEPSPKSSNNFQPHFNRGCRSYLSVQSPFYSKNVIWLLLPFQGNILPKTVLEIWYQLYPPEKKILKYVFALCRYNFTQHSWFWAIFLISFGWKRPFINDRITKIYL